MPRWAITVARIPIASCSNSALVTTFCHGIIRIGAFLDEGRPTSPFEPGSNGPKPLKKCFAQLGSWVRRRLRDDQYLPRINMVGISDRAAIAPVEFLPATGHFEAQSNAGQSVS